MAVRLDHTIVYCASPGKSSELWSRLFGRPAPYNVWGMFDIIDLDNGVSLFFGKPNGAGKFQPQHYAFIVSDAEFDQIFERVKREGLRYFADPFRTRPGEINHDDGGSGSISTIPTATMSKSSPGRMACLAEVVSCRTRRPE